MSQRRAYRWKPILTAAAAALFVAILGVLMTDLSLWYFFLEQPAWKPPDLLFGPAWTLIFALCAVAGVRAWERLRAQPSAREWLLAGFAANAFLNVFWSLLFFRLQRPDWALVEVPFLWLSILLLMWLLWPNGRGNALLLLPYLLWVSFAAVLNFEVVRLNAPFG